MFPLSWKKLNTTYKAFLTNYPVKIVYYINIPFLLHTFHLRACWYLKVCVCACLCVLPVSVCTFTWYVYVTCIINMYTCIWTLTHFCSSKNPIPGLLDVYFNFKKYFIFKVILANDRFKFYSYKTFDLYHALEDSGRIWHSVTLYHWVLFNSKAQ